MDIRYFLFMMFFLVSCASVDVTEQSNVPVQAPDIDTSTPDIPAAVELPEITVTAPVCTATSEICGNGIDEDCDKQDLACPKVAVTMSGAGIGITDLTCTIKKINNVGVCEGSIIILSGKFTYLTVKPSSEALTNWSNAMIVIIPQEPLDARVKTWIEKKKIETSAQCTGLSARKPKCSLTIPAVIEGLNRAEFSAAWRIELQ